VGIGSYVGETNLKDNYLSFLKEMGLRAGPLHGGFFPWTLREPAVGNIFLVGDAAGQCLPFTGEGIRPALYFGQYCGKIVQRIIDGEITLQEGLDQYRVFVDSYRPFFRTLLLIQKTLITFPNSWITGIGILVSKKSVLFRLMRMYEASFILEEAQIPRQASSILALKDVQRSSRREQWILVAERGVRQVQVSGHD
jgi:flavin-dependent dehydrogenase